MESSARPRSRFIVVIATVFCYHKANYALDYNATHEAIYVLDISSKKDRETFSTKAEQSHFSICPNVLVVRNSKRLGVLAIEVKRTKEKNLGNWSIKTEFWVTFPTIHHSLKFSGIKHLLCQ